MGGLLQNGVWRGYLYSNGIAEDDYPTLLEQLQNALRQAIEPLLALRVPMIP